MKRMQLIALALAGASSMLAAPAHSLPCAGFADVDSADTFCPSVEWIRNRGVTHGCNASQFCPNELGTRLQLAAFLHRLATVTRPVTFSRVDVWNTLDVWDPVRGAAEICRMGIGPAVGYERTAKLIARVEYFGYALGGYEIRPVIYGATGATVDYSVPPSHVQMAPHNGGAGNPWSNVPPTHFGQTTIFSSELTIPANITPEFALHFRPDTGTALSGDSFYVCTIRVEVLAR